MQILPGLFFSGVCLPITRLAADAAPILVYYAAQWAFGDFWAFAATLVWVLGELTFKLARRRRLTAFFLFSSGTMLAFGGLDLWVKVPAYLPAEPFLTNVLAAATAFLFIFCGRSILADISAEQGRPLPPQTVSFLGFIAFVWGLFFSFKGAVGYAFLQQPDLRTAPWVKILFGTPLMIGLGILSLLAPRLVVAMRPRPEPEVLSLVPLNSDKHTAALQVMMEAAPHYAHAVSNMPVARDAAAGIFQALPPNFSKDRKFVWGIMRGNQLVGVMDILRGFPLEETAMIGLLILREDCQGQGLGRMAYQAAELAMRRWPEIQKIRLGVVESNQGVIAFWRKMGFEDTGVRKPWESHGFASTSWILEKLL